MKVILLLLFISIKFVFKADCYKLMDPYYIPNHLLNLKDKKEPSIHVPSLLDNNRQENLYNLENLLYKKSLEKLSRVADELETKFIDNTDYPEDDRLNNAYYYDDELASYDSLGQGHKYVQGGSGEGQQYLQPDGSHQNYEEVKSDEGLPAYCDPPNPCPVDYIGEECDPRPFSEFTAQFSKEYQQNQDCMCDNDHNECNNDKHKKSSDDYVNYIKNLQSSKLDDRFSAVVAKKSPRTKRDIHHLNGVKNIKNPYLNGKPLNHVAKKSAPVL